MILVGVIYGTYALWTPKYSWINLCPRIVSKSFQVSGKLAVWGQLELSKTDSWMATTDILWTSNKKKDQWLTLHAYAGKIRETKVRKLCQDKLKYWTKWKIRTSCKNRPRANIILLIVRIFILSEFSFCPNFHFVRIFILCEFLTYPKADELVTEGLKKMSLFLFLDIS